MLTNPTAFYLSLNRITDDDELFNEQDRIEEECTNEVPNTETVYNIVHQATHKRIGFLTETYGQIEIVFDDEKAWCDFEKEKNPDIEPWTLIERHDPGDLFSATNLILEKVRFLKKGISNWTRVPENRRNRQNEV